MKDNILYRDAALNKVVIDVGVTYDSANDAIFASVQFASDLQKFECQVIFSNCQHYFRIKVKDSLLGSACQETIRLAKWMVLNGSYKAHPTKRYEGPDVIVISPRREEQGKVDYLYGVDGEAITILHPPLRALFVRESRIARRIIIAEMYPLQNALEDDIIRKAHFPEVIVRAELNGLRKSEYMASLASEEALLPDHADLASLCLTTRGREYYENMIGAGIGTVFIIAACRAENKNDDQAHQEIISQYKKSIATEGYEPIFQEHEEPKKNIYVDIFDYIDTCEFVIADITYDRPNCYVEIGYAIAKGKHIMGFMQREYFEKEKKDKKIPFDLFPIRFQEYGKGMVTDIEKYLKERFRVMGTRKPH